MKASEMSVLAPTVLLLVIGVRVAPTPSEEIAVGAASAVCAVIYIAYRVRRMQQWLGGCESHTHS